MRSRLPGLWLEYLLVAVLVVILIVTANALFGPYLRGEVIDLCVRYNLPCPGAPTQTPTPLITPTPTVTPGISPGGTLTPSPSITPGLAETETPPEAPTESPGDMP
jgi:hypothetical protein